MKDGHCIESIQKNVFRYFVFGKSDKIFTQSAFSLKTFKLNHSAVTHQFSKKRAKKMALLFRRVILVLIFEGNL